MVAWSLIAVILGLAFIIVRAFKGHPPFLSCLIAVVFISILSGHSIPDSIATAFATGTANMLRSMLLFFCACTLFGKVMEDAGYAHSITYFISDHVNAFWAPTIIFLTTVVLAMGGMLIATCIIVYPIGYRLLKKAGYSRRILAGANFAGFWTVTCCSPLIPSAANNLLQGMLGTDSRAGLIPGIVTTGFLFVTIIFYLQWQCKHWQKNGIVFEELSGEEGEEVSREGLPSFGEALLPILLVLILYNVFNIPVAVSMFSAVVLIVVLRFKKFGLKGWMDIVEKSPVCRRGPGSESVCHGRSWRSRCTDPVLSGTAHLAGGLHHQSVCPLLGRKYSDGRCCRIQYICHLHTGAEHSAAAGGLCSQGL